MNENENENEILGAEGETPDAEIEEQKTHIDDTPVEEEEAVIAAEDGEDAEAEPSEDGENAENAEDAPADEAALELPDDAQEGERVESDKAAKEGMVYIDVCPQCGAKLENGEFVCPSCGAMIENAFDDDETEFKNAVNKTVLTPVKIIAAAAAVIAIVAIVCVALFSGGKTEDKDYIFNCGLALVKQDGLYGYINKSGSFVIEPQFERAGAFNEWGYALIGEDNNGSYKYGAINKKGEIVIEPIYDMLHANDETGTFWFAEYDFVNYTVSYGLLDASGNVISDSVYSEASLFTEGLAIIGVLDDEGEALYGYIDKNGNVVIEPQFNNVYYFSEDGLAVVSVLSDDGEDLYGYVDKNGIVIEPQFDFASDFHNGFAVVETDGEQGLIDASGNFVIEQKYKALVWSTSENVGLAYADEDGFCVLDENGNYIASGYENIGAQLYDYVSDSDIFGSTGLLPVSENGKWGFVDRTGEFVIEPEYDDIYPFDDSSLAAVYLDGKWGFIDETGEKITELSFDEVYPFGDNDYASVSVDGQYGIIDKSGNYIVEPSFDMMGETDVEGLLMVMKDDLYGVIDKNGNTVVATEYEYLDVYADGIIFMENKLYGIMSTKGKVILEAKFDSLNGADDYCNAEGCENTVSDGEKYCSEHEDAEEEVIEDET